MRVLMLAVIGIFLVVTIGSVVLNRGSEKIVMTFFLGLVATIGALVSVLVFGENEPIHKAFSSFVMMDKAHMPLEVVGVDIIPIPVWTLVGIRDKLQADPELVRNPADSEASELYHHALQRAIVSWLKSKYPSSWEAEVLPIEFGEIRGYTFTGRGAQSKIYTAKELIQKMSDNKFAEIRDPNDGMPTFGLAVPPATELSIKAPHTDPRLGKVGQIIMRNQFCVMTIETRQSFYLRGIGSYAYILGVEQAHANELGTNTYLIIVDAQFSWYLAGHPDMPKYRKWASGIAVGLESQFADREMWLKARDWFALHRPGNAPSAPPF